MTQKEFNDLPAVLTPGDMHDITGLDRDGLKDLREGNPDMVLKRSGKGGKGRWLYKKSEVAKVVGMQYQ